MKLLEIFNTAVKYEIIEEDNYSFHVVSIDQPNEIVFLAKLGEDREIFGQNRRADCWQIEFHVEVAGKKEFSRSDLGNAPAILSFVIMCMKLLVKHNQSLDHPAEIFSFSVTNDDKKLALYRRMISKLSSMKTTQAKNDDATWIYLESK